MRTSDAELPGRVPRSSQQTSPDLISIIPASSATRRHHLPEVTERQHAVVEAVLVRHLVLLAGSVERHDGGWTVRLPDLDPLECRVDWAGPDGFALDEAAAQAAFGLMEVHGRPMGKPERIGVDYLSTAAGVLLVGGVLAATLARLRGGRTASVTVSAANVALLTVSQYLAAATAQDPEHQENTGRGMAPPFVSSDGVRFEMEALDPDPWRRMWLDMGIPPGEVAAGWRAFVLRYATGTAPLPLALHAAVAARDYAQMREVAAIAGVALQRLRSHAERRTDLDLDGRVEPPWTVRATRARPGADWPNYQASAPPSSGLPLAGMRVVEAGRRIQGPLAGHVLGLLGAKVVRIEPAGGDPLRGMPPMVGDCSARFLALNRGKRIVEADLRSAAGRAAVREEVARADVFVHNWAPGKARDLGLDDDDLRAVNPSLVYAHASGWGAARGAGAPPGTDFIVQAYAGLADHLHPPGRPPAGSLMTLLDVMGGFVAAEGILAGLVSRELGGRGQRVDSSLLSAASVLQMPFLESVGAGPRRQGELDDPLPTADGYVIISEGTGEPDLCRALGSRDVGGALRRLADLSTAESCRVIVAAGGRATPVRRDLGALAQEPFVAALLAVDGAAFPKPPWRFRR